MYRLAIAGLPAFVAVWLLAPAAAPPFKDAPFTLAKRIPFTGSRVVGFPDPLPPLRTRRVFEKLSFRLPVYLISHPAHDRLFVVLQNGRIVHFDPKKPAKPDLFCQLKDHDTYSFTFHPNYRTNRLVYVFANARTGKNKANNRIWAFRTKGDPPVCDPASGKLIIEWASNGHNGGDLGFGKDGMLYITAGDGTSDSDGDVTGQDLRDLCSGVLRINVDKPDPGKGYSVPKDNPFLKIKDARPELWAFGFRNPWRMTFDDKTGDLFVGDVGQDLWEMIHLVKKGGNYGWSVMEGSHPFQPLRKRGPGPILPPLIEHPHSESRSITGGVVYRGKKFKELQGVYIYGDYSTGKVWGLKQEKGKVTWRKDLAHTRLQIVGFGADRAGEVYIVDYTGQIHTFERRPAEKKKTPFPRNLTQTGLFASVKDHRVAPGVIPYSVNSPLWSDGADKVRFVALPGAETIAYTEDNAWQLPDRTVLVKTFTLGGKRIETRLLLREQGEWFGYSYAWNERQTDADLVESGGRDRVVTVTEKGKDRKQKWHFPSRVECMVCHTRAANYVLGLTTLQMNKVHDYDGVKKNQLEALADLGVLRFTTLDHWSMLERSAQLGGKLLRVTLRAGLPKSLGKRLIDPTSKKIEAKWERTRKQLRDRATKNAKPVNRLPWPAETYARLVDPADEKAPLEDRVRSYLHSNCAICHVWAGGGNSAIDLHANTTLANMKLLKVQPLHDRFEIKDALLVAPGEPRRSILYQRLVRRGRGQMPPLASSHADPLAVGLVEKWIRGLK